jgi:ubiquinone/menaquinone biosynthesis C-methylase UbiE
MTQVPIDTIAEAFSRTAEKYDSFAEDHPHLTRMRNKVYSHVLRHVPRGARILEFNAGTGTDAVELAQRGYFVHATDIAPGMLNRLPEKLDRLGLQERVTMEERSFLALEDVQGAPFDAVFSDLGGLNCIPDLTPVIQQLPKILRPGGTVTWVLMPHICLWEFAEIFRGNLSLAFRRLSPGRVRAQLEGLQFDVYYFSAGQVIRCFGDNFEVLALEGLSVFTPTAESKNFARRHSRLYRALSWLDDRLSPHWPWNGWGDFYMLTMRYRA